MITFSQWLEAGKPKHPISNTDMQRESKQSDNQAVHSLDKATMKELKQHVKMLAHIQADKKAGNSANKTSPNHLTKPDENTKPKDALLNRMTLRMLRNKLSDRVNQVQST